MERVRIALVAVGALTFSVFVIKGGTVQQQTNVLADAGITPNRDCTCPVRLDPDFALEQGLKQYQRVTFPCSVTTTGTGLRDVQMPPMPIQRVRDAIDVVDWNDCTMAASTAPVRALWGTSRPFTLAGVTKPWCRQKTDAGLPCALLDGGTYGDRNVSLCSTRLAPATCERVSGGGIYAGDDPEDL